MLLEAEKKKWLEWDREGGDSNKSFCYQDGCWAKAVPLHLDLWAVSRIPSRTAHAKGRKREHFSIALTRTGWECPGGINSLSFWTACTFGVDTGQKDETYRVHVWSGTISAWVWTYIYYMFTIAVAVIRSRHQSLLIPPEKNFKSPQTTRGFNSSEHNSLAISWKILNNQNIYPSHNNIALII